MGDLMMLAIAFGAGAVFGWMIMPAPKPVTDFWIRMGWAKPADGG
jgi:hypothetical protein